MNNPYIDEYGNKIYKNEKGQHHRIDESVIECSNRRKFWYVNEKLHRSNGPAVENADGNKGWYFNDKLHRLDGPAIEYTDDSKYWFINDIYISSIYDLLIIVLK